MLLDALEPTIRSSVGATAVVNGFSYRSPLSHYPRVDTEISPLDDAAPLFLPYAPSGDAAVTYVAYSLGGLLTCLGLGAWLANAALPSSRIQALVPRILLCQPAFDLSRAVSDRIVAEPLAAPATLVDLVLFRLEILTELAECLERIHGAGVSIDVLYWADDAFVEYATAPIGQPTVLDVLVSVGIRSTSVPLEDLAASSVDPFQAHCRVPQHPTFGRAVERVLRGERPWPGSAMEFPHQR